MLGAPLLIIPLVAAATPIWPHYGGTPLMNKRVPVAGPTYPVYGRVWRSLANESWDLGGFAQDDQGNLVLGTFVGAPDGGNPNRVVKITPDGTELWSTEIGSGGYCGWPGIAPGGWVYARTSENDTLYVLDGSDGRIAQTYDGGVCSNCKAPLGPGGVMYVGGDVGGIEKLKAMNIAGKVDWTFPPVGRRYGGGVAVAPDGTIYTSGSKNDAYLGGPMGIFAIRPDGTEKWFNPLGFVQNAVSADEQGNAYTLVNGGMLVSLDPDGGMRWSVDTGVQGGLLWEDPPAIDSAGNAYMLVVKGGSYDPSLSRFVAVSPTGALIWSIPSLKNGEHTRLGAVVDSTDTIFVNFGGTGYALRPDAGWRWRSTRGAGVPVAPNELLVMRSVKDDAGIPFAELWRAVEWTLALDELYLSGNALQLRVTTSMPPTDPETGVANLLQATLINAGLSAPCAAVATPPEWSWHCDVTVPNRFDARAEVYALEAAQGSVETDQLVSLAAPNGSNGTGLHVEVSGSAVRLVAPLGVGCDCAAPGSALWLVPTVLAMRLRRRAGVGNPHPNA